MQLARLTDDVAVVLILDSVGITDGKDQTLFNGMLNVWSLLFCIAIAFLSQRVSIRRLIVGGIAAMLTVWTLFTILSAREFITIKTRQEGADRELQAMQSRPLMGWPAACSSASLPSTPRTVAPGRRSS